MQESWEFGTSPQSFDQEFLPFPSSPCNNKLIWNRILFNVQGVLQIIYVRLEFTFNFVIPSKESSLSSDEFLLPISRFLQRNWLNLRLGMWSKSCTLSNSTMWHLLLGVVGCLSVIVSLTFGDEWVANTGIFLTWSLELLDCLISSFPEFQV